MLAIWQLVPSRIQMHASYLLTRIYVDLHNSITIIASFLQIHTSQLHPETIASLLARIYVGLDLHNIIITVQLALSRRKLASSIQSQVACQLESMKKQLNYDNNYSYLTEIQCRFSAPSIHCIGRKLLVLHTFIFTVYISQCP